MRLLRHSIFSISSQCAAVGGFEAKPKKTELSLDFGSAVLCVEIIADQEISTINDNYLPREKLDQDDPGQEEPVKKIKERKSSEQEPREKDEIFCDELG